MATTAHPQAPSPERPGLSDFAKALRAERARLGYSLYKVANQCGCGQFEVARWEEGTAVPSPIQYKRLMGLLRRLVISPAPNYRNGSGASIADSEVAKIREEMRPNEDEAKAMAGPALSIVKPIAPKPEPPAVPVAKPSPLTFGAALKQHREGNAMSQPAMGTLLGTHATALTKWEKDHNLPLKGHYDTIMQLLPELQKAIERGEVIRPVIHADRSAQGRAIRAAVKPNRRAAPVAAKVMVRPEPKIEAIELPKSVAKAKPKAKRTESLTFGQLAEQYARARADVIVKRKLVVSTREAWADAETACKEAEAKERAAMKALDAAT